MLKKFELLFNEKHITTNLENTEQWMKRWSFACDMCVPLRYCDPCSQGPINLDTVPSFRTPVTTLKSKSCIARPTVSGEFIEMVTKSFRSRTRLFLTSFRSKKTEAGFGWMGMGRLNNVSTKFFRLLRMDLNLATVSFLENDCTIMLKVAPGKIEDVRSAA